MVYPVLEMMKIGKRPVQPGKLEGGDLPVVRLASRLATYAIGCQAIPGNGLCRAGWETLNVVWGGCSVKNGFFRKPLENSLNVYDLWRSGLEWARKCKGRRRQRHGLRRGHIFSPLLKRKMEEGVGGEIRYGSDRKHTWVF